jgi:hypothetical protein
MAETNPTTPSTTLTLASTSNTTVFPIPATTTEVLDDGTIKVTVGDQYGYVSSYHLVTPKENQLIDAFRRNHARS